MLHVFAGESQCDVSVANRLFVGGFQKTEHTAVGAVKEVEVARLKPVVGTRLSLRPQAGQVLCGERETGMAIDELRHATGT